MSTPTDPPAGSRAEPVLIGRILDGRYRVEKVLGAGGMGSVYLARDEKLRKPVVVKVPHARFLHEEGFRERFEHEIRSLTELEHPHIVKVLDVGEIEEPGATPIPFAVLQFLGGGSLKEKLAAAGDRQTPSEVAWWILPIARALDFVHERGVVHRDVKPGNILFDARGEVFLADFGIVKALGSQETGLTQTGMIPGSPDYMAPEVARGDTLDGAYDQYALAVVAYQALAGRLPHGPAESPLRLLYLKASETAPALHVVARNVPEAVGAVVLRALSRSPAARYPTCGAFAKALIAAVVASGGRPPTSMPAAVIGIAQPVPASAVPPTSAPPAAGSTTPPPRSPIPMAGARVADPSATRPPSPLREPRPRSKPEAVGNAAPVPPASASHARRGRSRRLVVALPLLLAAALFGLVEARIVRIQGVGPFFTASPPPSSIPQTSGSVATQDPAPPATPSPAARDPLPEPARAARPVSEGLRSTARSTFAAAEQAQDELRMMALVDEAMTRFDGRAEDMSAKLSARVAAFRRVPEVVDLVCLDGGEVSKDVVRIRGRLASGRTTDSVRVFGTGVSHGPDGAFSTTVRLPGPGEHEIEAVVIDHAGAVRSTKRARVLVTFVPPWSAPLAEARAAAGVGDWETVSRRIRAARDAGAPEGSIDRDLLAGVQRFEGGVGLVLLHPADGVGVPDAEVRVMGEVHGLQKGDRVFVGRVEATISGTSFEAAVPVPDLGRHTLAVEVRRRGRVRASGERTVWRLRPDKTIPTWALLTPRQIAEAQVLGVPPAFENGLGLRFVLVPAGEFLMGSPVSEPGRDADEAQVRTTLTTSYYMSIAEVTNAQFRVFQRDHDSGSLSGMHLGEARKPVVNLEHEAAAKFAAWLSATDTPRRRYRLPTEAEWEHACRAGTTTGWWWGADGRRAPELENVLGPTAKAKLQLAWSAFDEDDPDLGASAVMTRKPNPWGLYDMLGNAQEWCSDLYGPRSQSPLVDPVGPTQGDRHVVRGGSWYLPPTRIRCAARTSPVGVRHPTIGFRLVCPVKTP